MIIDMFEFRLVRVRPLARLLFARRHAGGDVSRVEVAHVIPHSVGLRPAEPLFFITGRT